jgi:hypothetical protein
MQRLKSEGTVLAKLAPPAPAPPAPAASPPRPSVPTAIAPMPAPKTPSAQVCSAEDLKPLTAPAVVADRQMVGLRSPLSDIRAWHYVPLAEAAFPVNFTFDLSASAEKLIQYEPVVLEGTKLLVSPIPRLSWEDAKPDNRYAMRPAAGASATPASAEIPIGNPVLQADEIFADRGYVLSKDTTVKLRKHLRWVADLWGDISGAPINPDVLSDIANDVGKRTPSLLDLLQDDSDGVALKLPRLPPEWSRKPLQNLTAPQREEARAFVAHYFAGTRWLEEKFGAMREPCVWLFVRNERLFPMPQPSQRQ